MLGFEQMQCGGKKNKMQEIQPTLQLKRTLVDNTDKSFSDHFKKKKKKKRETATDTEKLKIKCQVNRKQSKRRKKKKQPATGNRQGGFIVS